MEALHCAAPILLLRVSTQFGRRMLLQVDPMFHAHIGKLIRNWRDEKGMQTAPTRGSLSPVAFGALMSQLFMLGAETKGDARFRVAGALANDLHGENLMGRSFVSLFRPYDRPRILAALQEASARCAPLVIKASGVATSGESIGLEIGLVPILGDAGRVERLMGLYQPVSTTARLSGETLSELHLRETVIVEDAARAPQPMLRLVVDNTRQVA